MKKIHFLSVILCFLIVCIPAVIQASSTAVVFQLSNTEGKAGERINVSVSVTSTEEINSIALYDLVYDPAVLTFVGFDNYSEIEEQCMFPGGMDNDKKVITLALRKSDKLDTYICDIQFEVNAEAVQTETAISVKTLVKNDSDVISSSMSGGTVTIQSTVVPHVHQMSYVTAKESTCHTAGNIAYWRCTSCNKNYTDTQGGTEVSNVTVSVSPSRHEGGTYLRGAYAASEYSYGYTGDLHCMGCGGMLQKGEIIQKLQDTGSPIMPGQQEIPNEDASSQLPSTPVSPDPVPTEKKKPTPIIPIKGEASWRNPFTDIKEDDPWFAAVRCMYVNGLFKGISETEFAPQMTMTRAMFVTVLGRLAGVSPNYSVSGLFRDVERDSWYAPYVEWAAEYSIVNGYGDGTFGVQDEITIEQASVILARYAEYVGESITSEIALVQYDDSSEISSWAEKAMGWAVQNRIYEVDGYYLHAKESATRSRIAMMLYAYILRSLL